MLFLNISGIVTGQNVRGHEVLQLRSSIVEALIRRVIFTVLVRHWSVCAEEGNGDTFCDARISESLSLNAVARKQDHHPLGPAHGGRRARVGADEVAGVEHGEQAYSPAGHREA